MNLPIGTLLQGGKYKIVKKLGQGTFGITYQAEMKVQGKLGPLDFHVAIKEFFMKEKNERRSDGSVTCSHSSAETCEYYRKKFKHEAENLSKMRHGNIVKVNDVFDENNTSYYVMELVAGGSLDSYINERHGLPEGEALRILREAGSAVSYMHSKRMLHLDIKPKNIMRSDDGHIFLIDFGLSKQFNKNGEPESSSHVGGGTERYAPPEQSDYKQDGSFPATLDIYALGATLYKMLTGSIPPLPNEILNEGIDRQLLEQKGVSKKTISVIEKAMKQKKAERYQTVQEMLSALPVIKEDEKEEEPEVIDTSEEDSTEYDMSDFLDPPAFEVGSKEAAEEALRLRAKANELFDKGSYEKALKLFLFSAELDEKDAEDNRIGWLYYNGKGTAQDYKKAFEWWFKSANKGYWADQYNLGMCYENGYGCKKDTKKAKEWYRKAMEQGDKDAKAAYERLDVHKESSLNIKGAAIALAVIILGVVSLRIMKSTPTFSDIQISDGVINGHEFVDLGLSVKWATCNIGGEAPVDSGEYVYSSSVYTSPEIADKANKRIDSKYPIPIVRSGDHAEKYWGAEFWRVPTKQEFEELINKCEWKWGKQTGKYGYKITGPNGKSIFLPAAGYKETYYNNNYIKGGYWCLNFNNDEKPELSSFSFDKSSRKIPRSSNISSCPIRAVAK